MGKYIHNDVLLFFLFGVRELREVISSSKTTAKLLSAPARAENNRSTTNHDNIEHEIMKYKSTRGGDEEYTFEEALFAGYAPNGGLFVPTTLPPITAEHLIPWSKLTFPNLAYSVFVSAIMHPLSSLLYAFSLALCMLFR